MNATLRLLGALLALLSACSQSGEKGRGSEAAQASHPQIAAFALAYAPTPGESAIAQAQRAVLERPEDAAVYAALAQAFLVRKRETSNTQLFALAKDAMRAARSLDPDSSLVRTSAVQLLFEDHQFSEAAAETRDLIASDPSNVTAHLLLSDALVELGDYDGAVDSLESAMELSPDLRVYARGSYLRWLDGDREGAIEFMVDAIKMGSGTHEAVAWCLVELGMMYWHANELDKASQVAASALVRVADYPPALELSARLAAARGQSDLAVEHYQSLLGRRSTVAALISFSELLEDLGRHEEAAEQRIVAESLAMHDPLALALHDARHKLHPIETLARAQAAFEERANVYTRDAYALALLRAGKAAAAKEVIGPELTHGSLDGSIWLHRGLILAANGELDDARNALEKALTLNAAVDARLVVELRGALNHGVTL